MADEINLSAPSGALRIQLSILYSFVDWAGPACSSCIFPIPPTSFARTSLQRLFYFHRHYVPNQPE